MLHPVLDILDRGLSHLILDGGVQAVPHWGKVLEVGGGPRRPTVKALGDTGESGRSPRVRSAPEPEISRKVAGTTGEVLTGGGVAAVDDGAAIFPEGCAAGLAAEGEVVLVAERAEEDMLEEARKGAKGEKS